MSRSGRKTVRPRRTWKESFLILHRKSNKPEKLPGFRDDEGEIA